MLFLQCSKLTLFSALLLVSLVSGEGKNKKRFEAIETKIKAIENGVGKLHFLHHLHFFMPCCNSKEHHTTILKKGLFTCLQQNLFFLVRHIDSFCLDFGISA